jgi:hypothetical protein
VTNAASAAAPIVAVPSPSSVNVTPAGSGPVSVRPGSREARGGDGHGVAKAGAHQRRARLAGDRGRLIDRRYERVGRPGVAPLWAVIVSGYVPPVPANDDVSQRHELGQRSPGLRVGPGRDSVDPCRSLIPAAASPAFSARGAWAGPHLGRPTSARRPGSGTRE